MPDHLPDPAQLNLHRDWRTASLLSLERVSQESRHAATRNPENTRQRTRGPIESAGRRRLNWPARLRVIPWRSAVDTAPV